MSAAAPPGPPVVDRPPWHARTTADVVRDLVTDGRLGLDPGEAARRLREVGPNELGEREARGAWGVLRAQLGSMLVLVLVAAAVVSALVGDVRDAAAIVAILVLNTVLGFVQEHRAERALAALRRLAVPAVVVRRGGRDVRASARDLVPGDLVLLRAGDLVPADCRLVEAVGLRAQEAALTGESQPVEKDVAVPTDPDPPLGDRRDMLYLGTAVVGGRARAVVVATGMATELGRIAALLGSIGRPATPLQRQLDQLGRRLAVAALALVGLISGLGLVRGEDPATLLLTAVSLAVAAIPEGLPTAVTIALAVGTRRLLRRRAQIRRLPAVETLGAVTVICSDKTGTLTQNRMAARVLWVGGERVDLERRDAGSVGGAEGAAAREAALGLALLAGALCNDASPDPGGSAGDDPLEVALAAAAAGRGLVRAELERALPRVAEVPFDAARRRMTTVHELSEGGRARLRGLPGLDGATHACFVKGALDELAGLCRWVGVVGGVEPMDAAWRRRVDAAGEELAATGVRVLGLAARALPRRPELAAGDDERNLVLLGVVGIVDPPRPEAQSAVAACLRAGIRPVIVTGDHPLTAGYVARELGLPDRPVLTGRDLERMSPEELAAAVDSAAIFARVSPAHKLAIVTALQERGHLVAMTGDGVNDAPALRRADLGVAMGVTGTDVAKEAADLVLLDDNFATIVAAVEEGRTVYGNIRKFVRYLLTSNAGELWVMLLAPFLGMPLPLLPLQILWINLVTDGLPALALGVQPGEPETMRRPPRRRGEPIVNRPMLWQILWVGLFMGVVSVAAGAWYWGQGVASWQTVLFTTVVFAQMANVLAIRSDRALSRPVRSDWRLFAAVGATIALQLAVVYVPALQATFGTRPLAPVDLALAALAGGLVFVAVEAEKLLRWPAREGAA